MLTAKDVSYWYDSEENTLYKDVNLNFEAGQLYGIIGSSGAGKTTLLTMLAGLDKPRKGEILVTHEKEVAASCDVQYLLQHKTFEEVTL